MRTLLTGWSGGIGTAISHRLSKKGHTLIGLGRTKPPVNSPISSFYKVDLNETDQVLDVCSQVKRDIPSLWSIVYVAGIYHPEVPFEEYPISVWDEVYNVNVRAAFILCQNLAPLLKEGGRIVTILSGAVQLGSMDVGYSSSKAALLGLTKSLAMILAHKRILVNAVCPGPTETELVKSIPQNVAKEMKTSILLKRFGKPDEVAVVVEFLLDPENSYITGATIDTNGGLYRR